MHQLIWHAVAFLSVPSYWIPRSRLMTIEAVTYDSCVRAPTSIFTCLSLLNRRAIDKCWGWSGVSRAVFLHSTCALSRNRYIMELQKVFLSSSMSFEWSRPAEDFLGMEKTLLKTPLLGKQIFRSWQRLMCNVGETTAN